MPVATVTARQGTQTVVAFADENGRYSMELPAGQWEIQVETGSSGGASVSKVNFDVYDALPTLRMGGRGRCG